MGQSSTKSEYISMQDDCDSRLFFGKVRKHILNEEKKGKRRLKISTDNMSDKAVEIGAELLVERSNNTLKCRTVESAFEKYLIFEWDSQIKIEAI
jgi:hypothetical protein